MLLYAFESDCSVPINDQTGIFISLNKRKSPLLTPIKTGGLKWGPIQTVRQKLLQTTDLHTILRLPIGIFYKPGVKANVIFFDKNPASPDRQTKDIWIYDFRTNIHFTLKQHLMCDADLQDFIACYNPENRHERKETWSEQNPDGAGANLAWMKF